MSGSWHQMVLDKAKREAEELAEQARRAVAEHRDNGDTQVYQDALIALTARIRALPTALAPYIIADLCGIIAWRQK